MGVGGPPKSRGMRSGSDRRAPIRTARRGEVRLTGAGARGVVVAGGAAAERGTGDAGTGRLRHERTVDAYHAAESGGSRPVSVPGGGSARRWCGRTWRTGRTRTRARAGIPTLSTGRRGQRERGGRNARPRAPAGARPRKCCAGTRGRALSLTAGGAGCRRGAVAPRVAAPFGAAVSRTLRAARPSPRRGSADVTGRFRRCPGDRRSLGHERRIVNGP